jgi:hypothetical protein
MWLKDLIYFDNKRFKHTNKPIRKGMWKYRIYEVAPDKYVVTHQFIFFRGNYKEWVEFNTVPLAFVQGFKIGLLS